MTGKATSNHPEDPAVAPIEVILKLRATEHGDFTEARKQAVHALWVCACVTLDDAPTWLIYDEPDGTLKWCRVPDGYEPLDLVNPQAAAGGHTDPASVLNWLRSEAPDPWAGGDGWGGPEVLPALGLRLQGQI